MFDRRTEPSPDWLPLRAAPLSIQAVPAENGSVAFQRLTREEIEAFIRERLIVGRVGACEIDFKQGRVALFWRPAMEEDDLYQIDEIELPAIPEWRPEGDDPRDFEDFFASSHWLWPELQRRFHNALRMQRWTIVGRIPSPYSPRFTEIALDDFFEQRIVDWAHGVSENQFGERIYSIHVVAASPALADVVKKWRSSPKAASVARVFYRALQGHFPANFTEHEIQMLRNALSGTITFNCRQAIYRVCFPENLEYTVSHVTVAEGIRLALKVHPHKPSQRQLAQLGLRHSNAFT